MYFIRNKTDISVSMSKQNVFAPVSGFPSPEDVKASYDSLTVRPLLAENNEHSREAISLETVSREGVSIVAKLLESLNKSVEDSDTKTVLEYPSDIPVFTAEHESKLLSECYPFVLPNNKTANMTPCASGQKCLGLHANIEGHEASGGVILRALLTPEELTSFERTGDSPQDPRLCILCARMYVSEAYFWCQDNRDEKLLQNTIINWYVNPRDSSGGYRKEYMIPLTAYPGWRCMVGPIVCNSLHKLRLVKKGHVWWIDQSKLIWKDAAEQRRSENAAAQYFR